MESRFGMYGFWLLAAVCGLIVTGSCLFFVPVGLAIAGAEAFISQNTRR